MKNALSAASNNLLVLAGPTASGKTEVALEISKLIPVEMISCDSMQIYRSMPIVTQCPAKPQTRKLKTHLVSFLPPSKEYSAAQFRLDARRLIGVIIKKKKMPLIVGGTGLYLRALLDGLFESEGGAAGKDEELRRKLLADQAQYGGQYLHEELKRIDALAAAKIHPNDLRRLVRAIEVFRITGIPLSEQRNNREGIRRDFQCRIFLLDRHREELYQRINRRVDRMVAQGLVREVKRLEGKRLSQTAGMALGIREIGAYLAGKLTLEQAVALLKKNTRNYAKRQLSWFRHEKGIETVSVGASMTNAQIAGRILQLWTGSHA